MNSYDIVVVGGGMVGAATAIGFAKQGLNVAVIEGFAPKAYDSQAMDIRVSADFSGLQLICLKSWVHGKASLQCEPVLTNVWKLRSTQNVVLGLMRIS